MLLGLQDRDMCSTFTDQCRPAGKLPIKNANTTQCSLEGCNVDQCCEVNLRLILCETIAQRLYGRIHRGIATCLS